MKDFAGRNEIMQAYKELVIITLKGFILCLFTCSVELLMHAAVQNRPSIISVAWICIVSPMDCKNLNARKQCLG